MKYSIIGLILIAALSTGELHAQKTTFGPHIVDYGEQVLIDGICEFWLRVRGSGPSYSPWCLFRHDSPGQHMEARFIVDWVIPQDSTYRTDVQSATIRFEYYGDNLPDPTISVWAFSTLASQMDRQTILDGMSGSPLFSINGANGVVEHTASSGAFLNTVIDGVAAGQLTLAFGLPDQSSLFDRFFEVDSIAVQLKIVFQDSLLVKITNLVDGIVDYDLEATSLVRGDLNQFIGNEADYAQLPAFEPPFVVRNWRVLYKHLAETWLAKYEHQSLPCRMKFRYWDMNLDRYKVRYLTDEYDGIQTEYRATSDSVSAARHSAKREITHEYDGLSIQFKDPWRVEQTLVAGIPSSQTIIDSYQDQPTPYEPWYDESSWGIFRNTKNSSALHYGARYWRYYQFNPIDDTYERKYDSDLQEGDLIHMDEIRSGRGAEISPSNGMEVMTIAPGSGDPFREYRLSYVDAINTMEFSGVYKAHLLTDMTQQPTRWGNQRKLTIDPSDVYHMVYESAGEVWYVNSEDGIQWSQEELVSDYSHTGSNPSIAASDSSVYVTYMQNGGVQLRRRYHGEWSDYLPENSGDNNGTSTTPVVAVGNTCYPGQGDIVIVAWDSNDRIEYDMKYLRYFGVYNATEISGCLVVDTVDNPVFPSITCQDSMTEFTICWRQGERVACSQIQVGGGTCDKDKFKHYTTSSSIADASLTTDRVVFAPSLTCDQFGYPVIAYEVLDSIWIYSNRWVNVRTYDPTSSSWNTAVYQVPFYSHTGYRDPISPSLGAHETSTGCGGLPDPGIRMAFHRNWGGGIRVGEIGCQYTEYEQLTNGECFPSVVPFSHNGKLREAYSAPYSIGPFRHAVRTTNAYLTKNVTQSIKMVRELRITTGNEYALLGVTDLHVGRGNNVRDVIGWQRLPDSLVIGHDCPAYDILYTEPFSLLSGNHIDYRSIIYCSDVMAMPAGVSISLQVRKASDGSIIHSFYVPLRSLPSDTAIWTSWSRQLTQAPAFPVYLSLGIEGTIPSGSVVGHTKVLLEDQYIPKVNVHESHTVVLPDDFVLEPNHPNPFNPITTISFVMGHEGYVKLSVFNTVGTEVAVLVDGWRIAGRYQEDFNAEHLPSGLYICRLMFEGNTKSRSMLLVK